MHICSTTQKSKYGPDRERIEELLSLGVSILKIAGTLDYPTHGGLTKYLYSRELRKHVKKQYGAGFVLIGDCAKKAKHKKLEEGKTLRIITTYVQSTITEKLTNNL